MVKVSADGRAKIRAREGCRLTAYKDGVGVLTIGVGHTGRMAGPKVFAGMKITAAQADTFLATDLAPVETAIATIKAALTQHQVDALASLAFNIGVNGFTGSTVVHKLNAGDVHGAADAFLMWEKPAALKGRREGERAQFLTADGPTLISAATIVAPVVDLKVNTPAPCARPDCPLASKAA